MTDLAPYAAASSSSDGRRYPEDPSHSSLFTLHVQHNLYQHDVLRILQATAFRQQEQKSRFALDQEEEQFRTRLSHAVELAFFCRYLARQLCLNETLAEAIALGYELGQPPFGVAGVTILNHCANSYGGFDPHVQSLRIVDELEEQYPQFRGLNLSFDTREGLLRQCPPKVAKTLGPVALRFLEPEHITPPSLEAQIVDLAQDILCTLHDLEDGLWAKLFGIRQLREYTLFDQHYSKTLKTWPNLSQRRIIHQTLHTMRLEQFNNLIETSQDQLDAMQPKNPEEVRLQPEPLITLSAQAFEPHLELSQFISTQLAQHHRARRIIYRAHHIIRRLYEAYNNDPYLLPIEAQLEVQRLQAQWGGDQGRAKAIIDHLASLTDRSLIKEYTSLFN